MKIYLKSADELAKMRGANLAVAAVLDACVAAVAPGVSTWDLNEVAARKIDELDVTSAFLGYHGYPAVLCTSVNEVVVHGIPRKDVVLKEGDIVGLDFGCFKDGFCGDAARTVPVGCVSEAAQKLLDVARESLARAIECCRPGNRLQDIGWTVQQYVEAHGFSVVRSFVGHGIGRQMHEDPAVPNYGARGRGLRLQAGMVLAIEPMVNEREAEVDVLADKWTAVTRDGGLSAHFEHSVAITDDGPWVLSQP